MVHKVLPTSPSFVEVKKQKIIKKGKEQGKKKFVQKKSLKRGTTKFEKARLKLSNKIIKEKKKIINNKDKIKDLNEKFDKAHFAVKDEKSVLRKIIKLKQRNRGMQLEIQSFTNDIFAIKRKEETMG